MVTVLLAAAGIATSGLKMPERIRTDPYVGPRGRNNQRFDPLQHRRARHGSPVRVNVPHARVADAPDAGYDRDVDVVKLRNLCRRDRIERRRLRETPANPALR